MVARIALTMAAVVVLAVAGLGSATGGPSPLSPDLRTLPPSRLQFALAGDKHILRFTNTAWNAGPGRLEIEGNPDPTAADKTIYQNLYDAPVGGEQVSRRVVDSDIIEHPGHQHFHFEDFAAYSLWQQRKDGNYKRLSKRGVKTSFCIMDTARQRGPVLEPYYTSCSQELQGLSAGWSDQYRWMLDDQWVVLGRRALKDGEYALRSEVDPVGLLDEGGGARENNNTAATYFTVKDGRITQVRSKP